MNWIGVDSYSYHSDETPELNEVSWTVCDEGQVRRCGDRRD